MRTHALTDNECSIKHVCKYCGYQKDEIWMKRISFTVLDKPYNICYSCAENFDRHGKWDEEKNDILWSAFSEEGE